MANKQQDYWPSTAFYIDPYKPFNDSDNLQTDLQKNERSETDGQLFQSIVMRGNQGYYFTNDQLEQRYTRHNLESKHQDEVSKANTYDR